MKSKDSNNKIRQIQNSPIKKINMNSTNKHTSSGGKKIEILPKNTSYTKEKTN